jgi:parvulin-like peptidyl-prolyl isomerase
MGNELRLLKDPLFHFLAAGALLFFVGMALKPAPREAETIVVNREALLSFIQYRSKAFEPAAAAAVLDGMTPEDRKLLIADYAREEALTREAQTLGLGENDYVIRQRMAQKVEFLAEAGAIVAEPAATEVEEFYDANKDRYTSPPAATLTHVFVSIEGKTRAEAKAQAEALLDKLKADGAQFADALKYGDRFLFHKNYVDRTRDYVGSQLGPEVEKAVFDETEALDQWRGPFSSQYGEHLVFVSAVAPETLAPFDDVAETVAADLAEERRQQAIDRAIDDIVAKYKIVDETGGA